jgi:hypothetical protein
MNSCLQTARHRRRNDRMQRQDSSFKIICSFPVAGKVRTQSRRVSRRLQILRRLANGRIHRCPREVKRRAVRRRVDHRRALDSRGTSMGLIAGTITAMAATLRGWVEQAERPAGRRGGLTSDGPDRLSAVETAHRERRRANAILETASGGGLQRQRVRVPGCSRRKVPSEIKRRVSTSSVGSRGPYPYALALR